VADVYRNWRNTIVNTRSFGSDPNRVIECVRAYIRGIKDAAPHMACTCKHFPGDGWDELDPHISPAHNEAGVEEWLSSYGRVYQTMIDEGLETIMTGQISLPHMSRMLRPGIRDGEILPASLAPELLQDLLHGFVCGAHLCGEATRLFFQILLCAFHLGDTAFELVHIGGLLLLLFFIIDDMAPLVKALNAEFGMAGECTSIHAAAPTDFISGSL
jgi:hypothetical protein